MRESLEVRSGAWTRHASARHVLPMASSLLLLACLESPVAPPRPPVVVPAQPSAPPPSPAPTSPPPAPPTSLEVRVTAVTTGVELDPDGYTIEVMNNPDEMLAGHRSDTVSTNGTTVFALGPGSYFAYLGGIAPNCTAVEPLDHRIDVNWSASENPPELLVSLPVLCLAIPDAQGVRVTTVSTGTLPATPTFQLELASDSGAVQPFFQNRSIGANESVTMPSPAGSYIIALGRAGWSRCTSGLPR